MATYSDGNSNNFVRLKKINGTYSISSLLQSGIPYQIDNINSSTLSQFQSLYNSQKYCPVYMVGGKEFTFYANLDTLESNANFSSWSLYVVHVDSDGGRSVETILGNTPFTKYIVSGIDYRFSVSFTCPVLDGGTYELVVVDTTDSSVLYVTNEISYRANATKEGIQLIKYRNDKDIFNYDYTLVSASFYTRVYLEFYYRQAGQKTTIIGYDLYSGAFTPVRSTTGRMLELITQSYMLGDHEAFNAMTLHNDFQMAYQGNWKQLRRSGDSSYSYDFPDTRDNFADGSITVEMIDTFTSNKNV